jgi:hypothetical protein
VAEWQRAERTLGVKRETLGVGREAAQGQEQTTDDLPFFLQAVLPLVSLPLLAWPLPDQRDLGENLRRLASCAPWASCGETFGLKRPG